ncbi:TonB-dependent receptor plug domain-containing protein [Thalassotalea atypica]|uniref:TonB-dependent receptor plug domain-containing protein n=1 Tax=Thalassotalea atypica TaxID=2054316 RepID=UPI002572A0AD|nr:TonB-dependent receptor [Thalassotalea atypica]
MKHVSYAFIFLSFSHLPFHVSAVDEVIVITADRLALNELNSAYNTEVIYEDQLIKQGYRSTVDAIGSVSGVLLQKTAHGQGSPYIRGFTGFRNLFLVDGIKLNNSIFRDGPNQYWNTVDPFSIGKFEVVKGPTSVVYGSDAIGGTINAITRNQSIEEVNIENPITVFYRGSTAEKSHQIRTTYETKLSKQSALSLGFSNKDFGDLIAGGDTNELAETGYDEFNLDLKWLYDLSNDWKFISAYFKTRQNDVPRTHKTIYGKSYAGTSVGSELQRNLDQNRELAYIKLSAAKLGYFADQAEFTLSYQNQSESRRRLRTRDRRDFQSIDVNTLGLNAHFYKQFTDSDFIYGVEFYKDDVDSYSSKNTVQGPVADEADYQWLGLYGQNKYALNKQVYIDVGLRWNYMKATADKVSDPISGNVIQLDENWNALVGNIRMNFQPILGQQSIYFGVSQGFRAPNLSDLTRFDSARTNEFETPALDLDSEHFITIDTGIKYRSTTFDYDLSVYYTDIDDQIQRVPTGYQNSDGEFEITKKNIGDGYAYGGEFDLKYYLNEQLTLSANFAYIEGKVDTFPTSEAVIEREYLDRLMPVNGRVGMTYAPVNSSWWLNTEIIAFATADKLSTRDSKDAQRIPPNGTPGYAVWNINTSYTFSNTMLFTLNVHNLLDKDYRVHGSGQNEAGINVIGSISYQF